MFQFIPWEPVKLIQANYPEFWTKYFKHIKEIDQSSPGLENFFICF